MGSIAIPESGWRRGGGRLDPLAAVHHTAVYRQHLCRILETVVGPLGTALRLRALGTHRRAAQLRELRDDLLAAQGESAQPSLHPSSHNVEVRAHACCDFLLGMLEWIRLITGVK